MQPYSAFSKLGLKHRISTGPLAGPVGMLRNYAQQLKGLRHPELGLLSREDAMLETVLARRVRHDWNCLDVGAHIGSVFYRLSRLAPDGTHAMIEASPAKARMLRNRFGAGKVHEIAATDTSGELTFYENLDQPGYSSLAERSSRGRIVERRVRAMRLDDLFPEQHFDFIKIDVEGFEYQALRGGADLLRRCRPLIQFEAGAVGDADLSDNTDQLYDLLTRQMGYEIYAAFDLFYDRPALTAAQFKSYRSYPYLAFNYFAVYSGQPTGR